MINSKELAEELLFIELKRPYVIEGSRLEKGLSLPVLREELYDGVLKRDWEREIKISSFFRGLALLASVSRESAEDEKYRELKKIFSKALPLFFSELEEMSFPEEVMRGILMGAMELFPEKGEIRVAYGQWEEARYNEKVYTLTPEENEEYLYELMKNYEKISADSPFYPFGLHRLSYLYSHIGQFTKAELAEEKALSLSLQEEWKEEARNHLEEMQDYVLMEKGEMAFYRGEWEEALELLNQISGDYPYPEKISYYKGSILMERGLVKEALPYVEEAYQKAPEEKIFLEKYGYLQSLLGNIQKARECYEKLVEQAPERFDLQYNLGLLLMEEGEKEEGIYRLTLAYNLNPTEPLRQYLLALRKEMK